ncbi:MAG: hypothetical protein Fues2KO_03490 [Fuerstiella sp.]
MVRFGPICGGKTAGVYHLPKSAKPLSEVFRLFPLPHTRAALFHSHFAALLQKCHKPGANP